MGIIVDEGDEFVNGAAAFPVYGGGGRGVQLPGKKPVGGREKKKKFGCVGKKSEKRRKKL
ncbi:MAG: hypothetical protein J1E06_00230 [Acutalibacter sp.]|nr:hypothetical protein [Acutalibacter sp.]